MDGAELDSVDEVLAAYALERRGLPERVAGGTLNYNYRVETNGGTVFVRRHRREPDVARVSGEHAVIEFAATHGIPVARPLMTSSGVTWFATPEGVWSVFPWIEGRTASRGQITAAEASVLGEMHGRIHAAFALHPGSADARFSMQWDKDRSLEVLARVAGLAAERQMEPVVQAAIAFQRELLGATHLESPAYFAGLPCQLTHGDYHDQQVLLARDGAANAVVDWELCQVTARVWEVVRALSFSGLLHTPQLGDYLRGYGRHVRLTAEECRLGVELWWQSRVNGVWVWSAYFLEGNERVAGFFPAIVPELERLADPVGRAALATRLMHAARSG